MVSLKICLLFSYENTLALSSFHTLIWKKWTNIKDGKNVNMSMGNGAGGIHHEI